MYPMKTKLCALLTALALPLLAADAHAQHLSVQEVPLTANHVLYDHFNGKVYASIPGTAALNPNTVAQINAATGAVEAYIPVAGGPDVLALSSDGSYLYVGTDTTSSVSRLNLTTNTVDQQFSVVIGPPSSQYPRYASNIVPLPGMPQSVAVTLDALGLSPSNEGVAVYDNGIQRTTVHGPADSEVGVLVGSNSPNRIYGYDNETTASTFIQLNLDASGITDGQRSDSFGTGILSGFVAKIKFDPGNGLVYATSGQVVDPVALTDVGTYPGFTPIGSYYTSTVDVVPSDAENRVYFLVGPSNSFYGTSAVLAVYNQAAFQQTASFTTSAAYLSVGDLSEISPTRFVFRSDRGVEFGTPQQLSSLTVAAALPSVMAGQTDQLTATATYPDGTTGDVTSLATWSSDAPAVATVNSTGFVTGVTAGIAHISATVSGHTASAPVAVTPVADVLWNSADGQVQVRGVNPDGTQTTLGTFGPYTDGGDQGVPGNTALWKAIAVARVPDGTLRLLWQHPDGRVMLWRLDASGVPLSITGYGPYTDTGDQGVPGNTAVWQAVGLSVSADGQTHLLWDHPDGRAMLWNVNADDTFSVIGGYGPYTDAGDFDPFGSTAVWHATALANAPDGSFRLLWNHPNGRVMLWDVSNAGAFVSLGGYGPYTDSTDAGVAGNTALWKAVAVQVGVYGQTNLLWNHPDGRSMLWTVDGFYSITGLSGYGPYTDAPISSSLWRAVGLALTPSSLPYVLWNNSDGRTVLWNVGADGTVNYSGIFEATSDSASQPWVPTALSGN